MRLRCLLGKSAIWMNLWEVSAATTKTTTTSVETNWQLTAVSSGEWWLLFRGSLKGSHLVENLFGQFSVEKKTTERFFLFTSDFFCSAGTKSDGELSLESSSKSRPGKKSKVNKLWSENKQPPEILKRRNVESPKVGLKSFSTKAIRET